MTTSTENRGHSTAAPGALEPVAVSSATADASATSAEELLVAAEAAVSRKDGRGALQSLSSAVAKGEGTAVFLRCIETSSSLAKLSPADHEQAQALLARLVERSRAEHGDIVVQERALEARARLHEAAGHAEAALSMFAALQRVLRDERTQAEVLERMGDIARNIGQPQRALLHYQAAFRHDRGRASATRKAMEVYFDAGREEQAKQLADVLEEQTAGDEKQAQLLAADYVRAAEALLVRPQSHAVMRDALDRAEKLVPASPRVATLRADVEAFPAQWKEHVRRLRDAALDARDKKDAARRYLAIAQIYASFAPKDPQVEQNIDKCLLLVPGFRPALKFLEGLYREAGRLNDLIERVKKLADGVRTTDVAVDLWLFVAVLLAERGAAPEELADIYERVRRIDPRNVAALQALIELHLEHGRYEKAATIMETYVAEATDVEARRQTLRHLARIYEVELRQLEKAAARLEQVRSLGDVDDDTVVSSLVDLYSRLGDDVRLADVLEAQVRTGPRKLDDVALAATLERLFGLYRGSVNNPEKAFEAGRRLFALQPRAALEDDVHALADSLGRVGEYGLALVEAAGRSISPAESRRMRLGAAEIFLGVGDRRRARAVLDQLLDADPRDPAATALIDAMLARDATPEEHATILEGRLRIFTEPHERARTLVALGDVYLRQKRPEDAVAQFALALDADTGDRVALEKLELVLRNLERWPDLVDVLQRRIHVEGDVGDVGAARAARLRLARLFEEKLDRLAAAAELYRELHGELATVAALEDPQRLEVLHALERLLEKGIAPAENAAALEPSYASVQNWRRVVDMLAIRRAAETDLSNRAQLGRAIVSTFEEKLHLPREAFDAACDVLLEQPQSSPTLAEVARLAELVTGWARFAEVLGEAATRLTEGPQRASLLSRRANLLQGVLGDQDAAIAAHEAILQSQADSAESLAALADLYESRADWPAARRILEMRAATVADADAASVCARLGLLLVHRFAGASARPWLERSLGAQPPLVGQVRLEVLTELAALLRELVEKSVHEPDAESFVEVLTLLASELAGRDRAAVRAEVGDVLLERLKRPREALAAYEAALANDGTNARAVAGIRALLKDEALPVADRQAAGRALLRQLDERPDPAARAHVLQILYGMETSAPARRGLLSQWATLLVDELGQSDLAFDAMLAHLAHDADDEAARRQAEAVAITLGRTDELCALYRRLRGSNDRRIARAYADRLTGFALERNDLLGAVEALRHIVSLEPDNVVAYERLFSLFERQQDRESAVWALEQLAQVAVGAQKVERLVTVSEYAFEVLLDSERGLRALREAHELVADDDRILARLDARLREHRADSEELLAVLERRARLQSSPSTRAALLADHALVALRLSKSAEAIQSLLGSLRAERDGQSTLRVTELLKRIAAGDGNDSIAALDAIIEHHREQKAWQPLVESLEIAAQKRPAGPARAPLFDEISVLHETSLRVPQLAFLATCHALRDAPTEERLSRARALASQCEGFPDLLEVCEDVAAAVAQTVNGKDVALTFLAEAAAIARRLEDRAAAERVAEATLRVDPGHRASLAVLESLHRAAADQARLIDVLKRQVEVATDPATRRQGLLELARLLGGHDDAGAEQALTRLIELDPADEAALAMLDELYERTGNSAAHAVVLERRIAQAHEPSPRAQLRTRLALLKLRRRGDPAGAFDDLTAAAGEDVMSRDVRAGFEALCEHARSRGAPPIAAVARALEVVLRAHSDWLAVIQVLELRVLSESDREARAALLLESTTLQEKLGQQALAFMTICRAVKEMPDDASLRAEAERLASSTDNLEALGVVYEDVLDVVREQSTRILLHKRIAQLAETVGHDPALARQRLIAAVQAGANDVDTLRELLRLTRAHGGPHDLSGVLRHLGEAAVRDGDTSTAKDAFIELADVDENLGDVDGAIRALRELLAIDPRDRSVRATLERLFALKERWQDLAEFLEDGARRAETPEDAGNHLARLAQLHLERRRDVPAAVRALQQLSSTLPTSDAILSLGARGLVYLAGDARPEARQLRADVAALIEPRYESQGAWAELAPVLRLRLEVEKAPDRRKSLLLRIIDVEERLLNKPELAMVSVARALGEDPADATLRERAERLSVRLHDLEGLLGVYEDLMARMGIEDPLRVLYATRCAELYEGGVGDPARGAEMYETALVAVVAQDQPAAERLKLLERIERLYRNVGEPGRLASTLKRRAELVAGSEPQLARQQLFEAATLEMHGLQDYGACIATLASLLKIAPQDLPALRSLAEACERQNRWGELAETLERELDALGATDPSRSLRTRFRLAVVLDSHLNLSAEALGHFQMVLEERPDHAEARDYLEQRFASGRSERFFGAEFLEQAYEKTGEWQKAIDVLQKVVPEIERRGDKREIRQHLVRIADLQEVSLRAPEMAFVTLCRALSHDASDGVVRTRLKDLARLGGTVDELCEVFEDEARSADVGGRSMVAAELREEAAGLYAFSLDDVPRGIAAFEAVLERNPGRLPSLEALTELYSRVGRWADVEATLRRRLVFRDDPTERRPLLLELAVVVSERLHRFDDAVGLLLEVRKHHPGDAAARRQLLGIYDATEQLEPLRELLVEELAACRAGDDAAGVASARHRLALLLANELPDALAAIPLWEEMREASGVVGVDVTFHALERLYGQAEKYLDLRKLYEQALAVERDPAQIAGLTARLGEVLSDHLGGKEEAVARHLKVLDLDPQNVTSLDALRTLYFDLGRFDELVLLLRRMMRATGDARRLKELRFQLALVLGGKLGKRAEAVETGRRILDIEPHTIGELEKVTEVFRACEAWEELTDVLERLAAQVQGPDRVRHLLDIADVFEVRLGRGRLAAPAYEKVLAVDPRNDRAYERLCGVYVDNAEWARLVQLKEERVRTAETAKERIRLLREIGDLLEQKQNQRSLAFLAACRAFREDYDDAELAGWMDRLALETDSAEELVTIYDDALGQITNEERILATHLRMAEIAWKHLSSPNDAELHFRRVLEVDGGNEPALEGLAALYESLQRWKDMVGVYERRVDRARDLAGRVEWLRRIARLWDSRAGDVESAIATYRRITELDGTNTLVLKELADLLEREQRWTALVAVLKRFEELATTLEERLAVRYRIAGLWETQLENPDQAVAVLRTILDDDPSYLQALKALERLFTSLNRPEELLKVFERMVQLAAHADEAIRILGKIASTYEESFEDLRSAVDAHERILKIDGANVAAVKNLERLLRTLGDWEQLIQAYELHIKLSRDMRDIVPLYLAVGEVYAKELGRTDRAEAAYNAALEFDSGSKEAIQLLGSLYEKTGNWFNALEKLQMEAQLKGATAEAVETYYRIGRINEDMLMNQQNAVIAYRAALQIEPSHLSSIRALRAIAESRGEHAERLYWLRAEAQYAPDDAERTSAHTRTGRFLQDTLADLEGAAAEFEQALAISFDHLDAARPLADISFRDENWARAEQLLDIIIERLEASAEASELCRQHYRLGYVCEKLGKEQKALKNYQRSYEVDSTYLPALEGLGPALAKAGRWEDASKIYQAILIHHRESLTDAEIVDYYQNLADLNHRLVQNDRAIKNLEKALELEPNHVPSLRLLATVLEGEQRFEEAYDAMIRLVPHVAGDERVKLLVELGRLAKSELDDPYRAIDAYEDANRQSPGDRDILTALLQLYRQSRQGPRAVEILEELVRIEPDEKARVRLNQTLGEVWRDEMRNEARATQYFNAALDLDPSFIKAFEAIEGMLSQSGNWAGLEQNYIAMLKRLPQVDPKGIKGVLWRNLGDLYRFKMKNLEGATQAYKVLTKMSPDAVDVIEVLADLLSRNPAAIDEAIGTWQRLVQLNPDKMAKPLHELVRLYLVRQLNDRCFLACSALKALNEATPQEQQLLQGFAKQAVTQAKRAMTDRAWDLRLMHPATRGPLAQLSAQLWRAAGAVLVRQPKDYGLDKKKFWEKEDLDAPVPKYFTTQVKFVRNVLNVGSFELWNKLDGAEPLGLLALEVPSLALGAGNPLLRDTNARSLWFQIARQLTGLRPAFILPRALGPQRFQAVVDVAVRLVEPRYPISADPRDVAEVERGFARIPGLAGALHPIVLELLKPRQPIAIKAFLEGIELTSLRAGYLLTTDLDLAFAIARQPDVGAPVAFAAKVKDLLLFSVSDEHLELRQLLDLSLP
jgi:tetratricopeptide (TPR) repeat protein